MYTGDMVHSYPLIVFCAPYTGPFPTLFSTAYLQAAAVRQFFCGHARQCVVAYCPQILYNFRRGQFCFQGTQRGNPLLINIPGKQKLRTTQIKKWFRIKM